MPEVAATLGSRIGSGAFGEVFEGTDPIHGGVAVKVLTRRTAESDAEWEARRSALLGEGERLASARHDHVVHVHYLGEHKPDAVWLVMERCADALSARCRLGPLPLIDVRNLLNDVAAGLAYLHDKGMLHRDIKPSNIMVTDKGRAKIGDFGLVTDQLLGGYGSQRGYVPHVAPEVFEGSPTSRASDIWAFGMTAYRLIHGEAWYVAQPRVCGYRGGSGLSGRLKWLPHVCSAWRRFIRKCLNDDPHDRFGSLAEVQNALANVPVDDGWTCDVGTHACTWTKPESKSARRRVVCWLRQPVRAQTWKAESHPVGVGGRTRTLASGGPHTSEKRLLSELKAFFE